MKRLPFVLPEWTRVAWASQEARAVWEPRIQAIGAAWAQAEKETVVSGFRSSALYLVQPERLPEEAAWAARRGLALVPLSREADPDGRYASSAREPRPGERWVYRVALTRRPAEWPDAWRDDRKIAELLGYPECCREFFQRTWVEERLVDSTWAMFQNTRRMPGHDDANILLRWIGVRAVPHLPCSFDCEATREVAHGFRVAMVDLGFAREAAWIQEMLAWPVEWDALHGIAEIRTPILKVSTRTDATADRLIVQRQGSRYPDEGASGLRFPFRNRQRVQLTRSPSFRRSIRAIEPWRDNGFASAAAEAEAHRMIVDALIGRSGPFLDLGAGNGMLLERLGRGGIGIERDPERVARAKAAGRNVVLGDIRQVDQCVSGRFDTALISVRRFEEFTADERAAVTAYLADHVEGVLLYSYDSPQFAEWLTTAELPDRIAEVVS